MTLFHRLMRDTKGAVLAEFVIAIVPILITFFSFVQLSKIATARLVVKHSAIVGARAAAVMANGKNNTPDITEAGQTSNEAEISDGVKAALGPWWTKGSIASVEVTVRDSSSKKDPYGWVDVKVSAIYQCTVPMGFLACGISRAKRLEESYRMPHQGARYQLM